MAIVTHVPPSIWLRLVLLFYKMVWIFRPLLRHLGIELKMSWNEVIFATRLLLPQIAGYGPQVVVGVGVGGAIWGAVLAGSLHDLPLVVVDRRVSRKKNARHVELIGKGAITNNSDLISGKKLLLVNAEMISGQTILTAKELVESLQPDDIKLACIDFNTISSVRPDFAYASHNGVIQKPWRRVKTYTNPDEPVRK